jgi:hypothetical protein
LFINRPNAKIEEVIALTYIPIAPFSHSFNIRILELISHCLLFPLDNDASFNFICGHGVNG